MSADMRGLRLPVNGLAPWVFIAVLSLGTYFLFSGGGHDVNIARSRHELWNLGHIVYFALLVYVLRQWFFFRGLSQPRQWALLIAITLLLGIAIEVSQIGTLRKPDWMDVSRDLMGCLLVLAFSPLRRQAGQIWPDVLRFAIGILLFIHLAPAGVALMDESFARRQFPVLSNFATPFELQRWQGNSRREIVRLNAQSGYHQMKIDLNTDLYSGAALEYLQGDWRGFDSLVLKLYQPQQEMLPITIRVHDEQHEQGLGAFQHHDRFHRRFMLTQGWNELVIPLYAIEAAPKTRRLDMAHISNVMLFSSRLAQPRSIYLQSVSLRRQ